MPPPTPQLRHAQIRHFPTSGSVDGKTTSESSGEQRKEVSMNPYLTAVPPWWTHDEISDGGSTPARDSTVEQAPIDQWTAFSTNTRRGYVSHNYGLQAPFKRGSFAESRAQQESLISTTEFQTAEDSKTKSVDQSTDSHIISPNRSYSNDVSESPRGNYSTESPFSSHSLRLGSLKRLSMPHEPRRSSSLRLSPEIMEYDRPLLSQKSSPPSPKPSFLHRTLLGLLTGLGGQIRSSSSSSESDSSPPRPILGGYFGTPGKKGSRGAHGSSPVMDPEHKRRAEEAVIEASEDSIDLIVKVYKSKSRSTRQRRNSTRSTTGSQDSNAGLSPRYLRSAASLQKLRELPDVAPTVHPIVPGTILHDMSPRKGMTPLDLGCHFLNYEIEPNSSPMQRSRSSSRGSLSNKTNLPSLLDEPPSYDWDMGLPPVSTDWSDYPVIDGRDPATTPLVTIPLSFDGNADDEFSDTASVSHIEFPSLPSSLDSSLHTSGFVASPVPLDDDEDYYIDNDYPPYRKPSRYYSGLSSTAPNPKAGKSDEASDCALSDDDSSNPAVLGEGNLTIPDAITGTVSEESCTISLFERAARSRRGRIALYSSTEAVDGSSLTDVPRGSDVTDREDDGDVGMIDTDDEMAPLVRVWSRGPYSLL